MKEIGYFKFIFSNKKANYYWSLLFTLLVIYTLIFSLSLQDFSYKIYLPPIFVAIIYLQYYTSSYINYRKYFFLIQKLKKLNIAYQTGNRVTEIYSRKSSIKPIILNFDISINTKAYKDLCRFIQLNKSIILFCKVRDFGILDRYIKPIFIVDNEYITDYPFKIKKNRVIRDFYKEHNDMIIAFQNNIENLYKIKLLNYYSADRY